MCSMTSSSFGSFESFSFNSSICAFRDSHSVLCDRLARVMSSSSCSPVKNARFFCMPSSVDSRSSSALESFSCFSFPSKALVLLIPSSISSQTAFFRFRVRWSFRFSLLKRSKTRGGLLNKGGDRASSIGVGLGVVTELLTAITLLP